MRGTQPTTKRPKFLQQPTSNCYNGYMINNNNNVYPYLLLLFTVSFSLSFVDGLAPALAGLVSVPVLVLGTGRVFGFVPVPVLALVFVLFLPDTNTNLALNFHFYFLAENRIFSVFLKKGNGFFSTSHFDLIVNRILTSESSYEVGKYKIFLRFLTYQIKFRFFESLGLIPIRCI